jgi:hypothetical protein
MLEFDLPAMPGTTPIADAFPRLIHENVSGLVVESGGLHRLLHYSELLDAWNGGAATLNDFPGGVIVQPEFEGFAEPALYALRTSPVRDYALISVAGGKARVRSRKEPLAAMYIAGSAGYCCDAPAHHCYPPNTRGADDWCVVPLCPGRL